MIVLDYGAVELFYNVFMEYSLSSKWGEQNNGNTCYHV